jgi:hypothetical protein
MSRFAPAFASDEDQTARAIGLHLKLDLGVEQFRGPRARIDRDEVSELRDSERPSGGSAQDAEAPLPWQLQ